MEEGDYTQIGEKKDYVKGYEEYKKNKPSFLSQVGSDLKTSFVSLGSKIKEDYRQYKANAPQREAQRLKSRQAKLKQLKFESEIEREKTKIFNYKNERWKQQQTRINQPTMQNPFMPQNNKRFKPPQFRL